MLSLSKLIEYTDPKTLEKGHRVKILSARTGTSFATKLPKIVAETRSTDTPEGFHYITAVDYEGSQRLKLSCTCPHFVFYLEKPLYAEGSADLRYSRHLPTATYRGKIPGLCAHLYGVILFLQQSGRM